MKNATLATAAFLNSTFGYDVVVDGDTMTAKVYCGEYYLYDLIFNWSE